MAAKELGIGWAWVWVSVWALNLFLMLQSCHKPTCDMCFHGFYGYRFVPSASVYSVPGLQRKNVTARALT